MTRMQHSPTMPANIFLAVTPPTSKIRVAGDLDADSAWKVDDALENCFRDGIRVVVLDGTDLSSISPEGLEALVRLQVRCCLERVGFMMILRPAIRSLLKFRETVS